MCKWELKLLIFPNQMEKIKDGASFSEIMQGFIEIMLLSQNGN